MLYYNTPGTSGTLSPYSNIKGLNFDDSLEPDNFRFEYLNAVKKEMDEEGLEYVDIIVDNKDDYYSFLNNIHKFGIDNISVTCIKREKEYDRVVEEEEFEISNDTQPAQDKKPEKKPKKKKGKK